jgi:hypothetical protein
LLNVRLQPQRLTMTPAAVGCKLMLGRHYIFTLDKPAGVMARRHMLKGYISL